MNRLVLIGNGFDLAHGLKTSYADFINWYKAHRVESLGKEHSNVSKDSLLTIELKKRQALSIYVSNLFWENQNVTHLDVFDYIVQNTLDFEVEFSPFFERITKSVETKGWVDIENEYYTLLTEYALPALPVPIVKEGVNELNEQLHFLQELLVEYLNIISKQEVKIIPSIESAISSCITEKDLSIEGVNLLTLHRAYWEKETFKDVSQLEEKIDKFGWNYKQTMSIVNTWKEAPKLNTMPEAFMLPDDIMFLNFNYTNTVQHYIKPRYKNCENHIHGEIIDPQSVIFGYGDELDDKFNGLKAHKNNECLRNVKSIRYLEAPNYRKMLSFIESAPYQVLIMGHSCGNSDRTLLNTIFEHKNCVSIKPYYYKKEDGTDNYIEMVQNISRNFTDMKLMRDRVVNKTQCEPLVHD